MQRVVGFFCLKYYVLSLNTSAFLGRVLWSAVLLNKLLFGILICKVLFIEVNYFFLNVFYFWWNVDAYICTHACFGGVVCVYIHMHKVNHLWCVYFGFIMYIITYMFLSHSLIFEKFSTGDPDTKDNSVGIQLLGIVLANNLAPFDPKCEIDRGRWEKSIFWRN